MGDRSGGSWADPPPDVHAGDQWSGDMCRTGCQLEVTAGDLAGDGEYCPGRLRTRGDGVLATVNFMQGLVGRGAAREVSEPGLASLRRGGGCGRA